AALDSIDFQFAMSVNENAGFFDIENKGEGGARALYSLQKRSDKTTSDIARDTLEWAINYYNLRMLKMAQEGFGNAQKFMEDQSLTSDISYLRTLSNLGVVYLMQGRAIDAEKYINLS